MHMHQADHHHILSARFSHDGTCLIVGDKNGFCVYRVNPFELLLERDLNPYGLKKNGVHVVEMLYNIMAMAGGADGGPWGRDSAIVWNDKDMSLLAGMSFPSNVLALQMRRDVLMVALRFEVRFYALKTLEKIQFFKTTDNPHGVCHMAPCSTHVIAAVPGPSIKGSIRILRLVVTNERFEDSDEEVASNESEFQPQSVIFSAHTNSLVAVRLNKSGTFVATASDRGTLIRVYDTENGFMLNELRRGTEKATIYSISISWDDCWLAVSSDKTTLHVWSLHFLADTCDVENASVFEESEAHVFVDPQPHTSTHTHTSAHTNALIQRRSSIDSHARPSYCESEEISNHDQGDALTPHTVPDPSSQYHIVNAKQDWEKSRNSTFSNASVFAKFATYFKSQWSFAKLHLPKECTRSRSICCFDKNSNHISVFLTEGTLMSAVFDPILGGEMHVDFLERLT